MNLKLQQRKDGWYIVDDTGEVFGGPFRSAEDAGSAAKAAGISLKVTTPLSGLSEADLLAGLRAGRFTEQQVRDELKADGYGEVAINDTVDKARAKKITPPSLPGGAGFGDRGTGTISPEQLVETMGPDAAYRALVSERGIAPMQAQLQIADVLAKANAPKPGPNLQAVTNARGQGGTFNPQTGGVTLNPFFDKPVPTPAEQLNYTPKTVAEYYDMLKLIGLEQAQKERVANQNLGLSLGYFQPPAYSQGTGKGGLVLQEPAAIVGQSGKTYGVIGPDESLSITPTANQDMGDVQREQAMGQQMGGIQSFQTGGLVTYGNNLTPYQQALMQASLQLGLRNSIIGPAPMTHSVSGPGQGSTSTGGGGSDFIPEAFMPATAAQSNYLNTQGNILAERKKELEGIQAAQDNVQEAMDVARAQLERAPYDRRAVELGGLNAPTAIQRPLEGDTSGITPPPGTYWAFETVADRLSRIAARKEENRGIQLDEAQLAAAREDLQNLIDRVKHQQDQNNKAAAARGSTTTSGGGGLSSIGGFSSSSFRIPRKVA